MSHIQKEIVVGLLYRKEESRESIKDALIRFIQYNNAATDPHLKPTNNIEETQAIVDQGMAKNDIWKQLELQELCEVTFEKEIRIYENLYPKRRHSSPMLFDDHNEFQWLDIDP